MLQKLVPDCQPHFLCHASNDTIDPQNEVLAEHHFIAFSEGVFDFADDVESIYSVIGFVNRQIHQSIHPLRFFQQRAITIHLSDHCSHKI